MEAYADLGWPGRGTTGRTRPTIRPLRAPLALVGGAPLRPSPLREIERLAREFAGVADLDGAIAQAYKRALALTGAAKPPVLAERTALVAFAADMVAALAAQLVLHDDGLRAMVDQLQARAMIPRRVLGREALRAPQLLQLPPPLAVDVQLGLLLAFTEARAATLWVQTPGRDATMLAGAGEVDVMPADAQAIAGRIIVGETVTARAEGDLAAAEIHRWQKPPAALLVFGTDALSPDRRLLLESAEPGLALALERQEPADGAAPVGSSAMGSCSGDGGQQEPVTAAERRLTRLRFDLHDGPQQDILMLADDLKLFRSQLESVLAGDQCDHLLGRVDDLEARLIALDGDLRRISVSVQSPFLHQKSFEDALDTVIEGFTARTGLTPSVTVTGDFTTLTDSQHITLLGLIREALSNVREHSHADHVEVAVSTDGGAVTASVTDDGRGFDPEAMLVRAARHGRLGLVGMHERVRLLGGCTTIASKPGGPTMVAATLPPAPPKAPRRADR